MKTTFCKFHDICSVTKPYRGIDILLLVINFHFIFCGQKKMPGHLPSWKGVPYTRFVNGKHDFKICRVTLFMSYCRDAVRGVTRNLSLHNTWEFSIYKSNTNSRILTGALLWNYSFKLLNECPGIFIVICRQIRRVFPSKFILNIVEYIYHPLQVINSVKVPSWLESWYYNGLFLKSKKSLPEMSLTSIFLPIHLLWPYSIQGMDNTNWKCYTNIHRNSISATFSLSDSLTLVAFIFPC